MTGADIAVAAVATKVAADSSIAPVVTSLASNINVVIINMYLDPSLMSYIG